VNEAELPTRENCDLHDPEEMFLWMFVALPGIKGAPLLLPMAFWRKVSKHLYELGVRLACERCGHATPPTKKLQPPADGDAHWVTGTGKWVPLDTPIPRKDTAKDVARRLSQKKRADLMRALREVAEEEAALSNPERPDKED